MLETKERRVDPRVLELFDPPPPESHAFFEHRLVRGIAGWMLGALIAGSVVFGVYYVRFARVIDRRLSAGAF